MNDEELETHFARLRDRFRLRLSTYRDRLVEARNDYVARADEQVVRRMRSIAHELAGAGGTFGYPDLSEFAAELETAADSVLYGQEQPVVVAAPLRQLLRELELTL
jgi:HPt (histidine-containing phosphotransfer) domain-containing protein